MQYWSKFLANNKLFAKIRFLHNFNFYIPSLLKTIKSLAKFIPKYLENNLTLLKILS